MASPPLRAFAALVLLLGSAAACARHRAPPSSAPPERRADGGANAVSTLEADEIAGMRATSVEQLLMGRVPGLEVRRSGGGEYAFYIRGGRTFLGNDEALVVLDGMYIRPGGLSQALSGVRPYDVARVQVLKDAGATASYGVQGANGVVLITTRRR